MQPYKPALRRISAYLCCRPGEAATLLCSSLASQYWMLAGSGAKLDGPGGALRVAGLTAIYGKVFQVWLDDQSPSLDKTMAALDKRLAKGERMLSGDRNGVRRCLPRRLRVHAARLDTRRPRRSRVRNRRDRPQVPVH